MNANEIYRRPTQRPSEKKELSNEIVQNTVMREKIYPKMKTVEDLENTDYVGLYNPLANFKGTKKLPAKQQEFYNDMNIVKQALTRRTLKNQNADQYLNELFKAKTLLEFNKITKGTPSEEYLALKQGWEKYRPYRAHLKKQVSVEEMMNAKQKTALSQTMEYSNSAQVTVAKKIQDFRKNWAGLNGNQRVVAGFTMVLGAAWLLNSNHEGVAKIRGLLGKAAMVGIGAYAVNTVSKLSGKSLFEYGKAWQDDKSGKRDVFKTAFKIDKYDAETMNSAIVHLGDKDFTYLAEKYLNSKTKFDETSVIANEHRELNIAGISESDLSGKEAYRSMAILDKKLKQQGTSIAELKDKIKEYKIKAERENKPFLIPTFAQIITQVLLKEDIGIIIGDNGKPELIAMHEMEEKVKWSKAHKKETVKWWPLTGNPENWKTAAYEYEPYPANSIKEKNLENISSKVLDDKAPLNDFIKPTNLGQYSQGFSSLYKHQYKNNPRQLFHLMENGTTNTAYIMQQEKVDKGLRLQKNRVHVNTIKNAHNKALINLRKKYLKKTNGKYTHPKVARMINDGRLHEIVQTVGGVFQAPSVEGKLDYPSNYIMFLRVVLPGSIEFKLRNEKEWPEGDMMKAMHEIPMQKGEKITRSDFKRLAEENFREKIGDKLVSTLAFKGAYESFLAKTGLTKNETVKIDKLLAYFSKMYAGKGLTKAGLMRYLASHNIAYEELNTAHKQALGAQGNNSTDKYVERYDRVNTITRQVIGEKIKIVGGNFSLEEKKRISASMFNFSNLFILAVNGDKKALNLIKKPLFPAIHLKNKISISQNTNNTFKPENFKYMLYFYELYMKSIATMPKGELLDHVDRFEKQDLVKNYMQTY
jgi:hypothetical protein